MIHPNLKPSLLIFKTSYWKKPLPVRDFDFLTCIDGDEESGLCGAGATLDASIIELASILAESGKYEPSTLVEHECATCDGSGRADVKHPLYGSPSCPELWTTIECPDCNGSGTLQVSLSDLAECKDL